MANIKCLYCRMYIFSWMAELRISWITTSYPANNSFSFHPGVGDLHRVGFGLFNLIIQLDLIKFNQLIYFDWSINQIPRHFRKSHSLFKSHTSRTYSTDDIYFLEWPNYEFRERHAYTFTTTLSLFIQELETCTAPDWAYLIFLFCWI